MSWDSNRKTQGYFTAIPMLTGRSRFIFRCRFKFYKTDERTSRIPKIVGGRGDLINPEDSHWITQNSKGKYHEETSTLE